MHSHTTPKITYRSAMRLIGLAIDHASANNWHIAVVVLDPNGQMVAAGRMDNVAPAILDIASDKAFTAALGKSSKAYFERMSSSPDLAMGAANRPRFCAWEGGLGIREGGTLIGALGVSGAAGHEDAACGEAALAALGLDST